MKFSDLNAAIQVQLDVERREALAYVTHYLHTKDTSASQCFAAKALPHIGALGREPVEWDIPFPPLPRPDFEFVDLFAGVGGMRMALQNLGGKCVFSSEWDEHAQRQYYENYGEIPFGDITKIAEQEIPAHQFLVAGFPCQAFSIAGRRGGFDDTRGTLFRDVARILKWHEPSVFVLENVKGLMNHDRGRTLSTILNVLRNDLGYFVPDPEIINARDFGVPQNRERVFIAGFHERTGVTSFQYPEPAGPSVVISDILEENPVSAKYYLSTRYLQTLREHRARHEAAGHGFGFEVRPLSGVANAIVVGGMGRERNLIQDDRLQDFTPVTNIKGEINREGIRKMTPREWARLQGFPDKYRIVVSDAQAYKQFGNSVAVPAVQSVAAAVLSRVSL